MTQKFKTFSLRWFLIPRLFRICKIRWSWSLFCFGTFLQVLIKKIYLEFWCTWLIPQQFNRSDLKPLAFLVNPIQYGGRPKSPPTSFFSVTSAKVGISPQNFLILVLALLPHWCKISSSYLVPVPNYWTWIKTAPQKPSFFWSNPYKIDIMITSLIEILELPILAHMTLFTT